MWNLFRRLPLGSKPETTHLWQRKPRASGLWSLLPVNLPIENNRARARRKQSTKSWNPKQLRKLRSWSSSRTNNAKKNKSWEIGRLESSSKNSNLNSKRRRRKSRCFKSLRWKNKKSRNRNYTWSKNRRRTPKFKKKSWSRSKPRRSREKLIKRQRAKYRPKSKPQSRRKSNCENRSFRKRRTRLKLRRRRLCKNPREEKVRWRQDLATMCQYRRGESKNSFIRTPARKLVKRPCLKAHLLRRSRRHQFPSQIILLPSRRLNLHKTLSQPSPCRTTK